MLSTVEVDLMKTLADHVSDPAITIYIPTHTKGKETEQDHIRLKNAVTQVEAKLKESGLDTDHRQRLLTPIRERVSDREFWQHQGSGLALFRSDSVYQEIRLPMEVTERVRVRDRFSITPLVEATAEHRIHVLALSRDNARLFDLGRLGGTELELPEGTPRSMEEANWFMDRERQLQDRATNRGASQKEFHGHDDSGSERADLRRFLRELSDGVKQVVGDSPVVVSAVTELAAAYAHDAHHRVSDRVIPGNPDSLDLFSLREKAIDVIEDLRSQAESGLVESWRSSVAGSLGTEGIIDTVIAAQHGRVDTLLVGDTTPIWGTFDPVESEVVVYDERGSDHTNLLEDCIRATLSHSGKVVAVQSMDSPIGSRLRY